MQKWVHLTLADGKTIDATEGHPFNTPEGWRDALLLKKGGQVILKGENGEAKSIEIADVRVAERRLTTYNLEVANAHTFFVGEDAVLVHNGKKYYTKKKKQQRFDEVGGCCEYCGKQMQMDTPFQHDSAEGDHAFAQALGGLTSDENLVLACRECNGAGNKGKKLLGVEWFPSNPNSRVKKIMAKIMEK